MGERIKQLRIEHGLTQKQLGEAVGLTPNAIANYEIGIREPSVETIKALCRILDVSADYLLGLTDDY